MVAGRAKAIDDSNGNDTIFIPWIDSTADLQFWQDGTTLYINAMDGTGDGAINRIAIEGWADGFGRGTIETVHYLNYQGSMRSADLNELAQSYLGLGGGGGWNLNSKTASSFSATQEQEPLPSPGEIFGEPLSGYTDHLEWFDGGEVTAESEKLFAADSKDSQVFGSTTEPPSPIIALQALGDPELPIFIESTQFFG